MGLYNLPRAWFVLDDDGWRHGHADDDAVVRRGFCLHAYHVGGDDARDDAAFGYTRRNDLRAGPREAGGGRATLRANGQLRGGVYVGLAGVLAGGDGIELVAAHGRRAFLNDGEGCADCGRRDVDTRRVVSVDAAQERLPGALPLAHEFSDGSLAGGNPGCREDGASPRGLLSWLLLDADGAVVCIGRHEPAVGCRTYNRSVGGKDVAIREVSEPGIGLGFDCLGRVADHARLSNRWCIHRLDKCHRRAIFNTSPDKQFLREVKVRSEPKTEIGERVC